MTPSARQFPQGERSPHGAECSGVAHGGARACRAASTRSMRATDQDNLVVFANLLDRRVKR
ncbi:MAG: hypothetical protein WKF83_06815 [Nocardioidaceae bacterium]